MNRDNNNFRPLVHWQHEQVQGQVPYEDFIPMDPSFPLHFPIHANLQNNRDALNLRWPPSALASFGGATHSPLRILILDNIAREVNQRPRRTMIPQSPQRFIGQSPMAVPTSTPQSPQRFIGQSHMAVPTSTQNESILTQEEQKDVLNKLKKEIYNPMPKRIIQRLNLYYRDNNAGKSSKNNKGKDIVNEDEDEKRCAVCLEDFEPKEVVMLTPCNHMFHEDCIVPWVKSHGKCPVCRFAIYERLKESILPSNSNNNEATYMAANDPFTGALISYIRAMDEARGVSTRVPNPPPLWF